MLTAEFSTNASNHLEIMPARRGGAGRGGGSDRVGVGVRKAHRNAIIRLAVNYATD